MKTVILGVGNILQKDEGLGVRAVEIIKDRFDLGDDVRIIDGGTMGLDLLPFIEGNDKILIVDAVNTGGKPGTIVRLEGDEVPRFLSTKLSVHQIGLPDMLSAAMLMGIMPEEVCLIGIQPETIGSGTELSESIKHKMEDIITAVVETLEKWGISPELKKVF